MLPTNSHPTDVHRSSPPSLRGYSYQTDEVIQARDRGELLCLRLDTHHTCNLKCVYCYSESGPDVSLPVMGLEDACDTVKQARDLGAKSVVYLGGGEPLMYQHFWPLIEYMHQIGLVPVVFTNSTLLTREIADRLFDLGASIMAKLDGQAVAQEALTGTGTFARIMSGVQAALDAGFASGDGTVTRLGIAPCVTTTNLADIPDIWRFARRNRAFPNAERATIIGRTHANLSITPGQTRRLIKELETIDRTEFGIDWPAGYSSIPGHSCYAFLVGCHVKSDRGVALCPEFDSVANLNETSLAEILKSQLFAQTRYIEQHVKEPCRSCEQIRYCFGGCRSKAYYADHDLFAPDPFCPLVAMRAKQSSECHVNEREVRTLPLL